MASRNLGITYLVITISLYEYTSASAIVRKCCNPGESLSSSQKCINDTSRDPTDWIPKDKFIVHSSRTIQKISRDKVKNAIEEIYKNFEVGFPGCDPVWRDFALAWKKAGRDDQFYMIYDSDKQISLSLKRESIFHDNATLTFKKTFPKDTFCIDSGPGDSYIAMICPCNEVTCVRKCCFQDMVFDEDEMKCVSIENLNLTDDNYNNYKDWRPTFQKIDVRFQLDLPVYDVEYFLLNSKKPTCLGDRAIFIEKAKEANSFVFQPDGSVDIYNNDKEITLPEGEFCGDYGISKGNYSSLSSILLRCASLESQKQQNEGWKRVKLYAPLLLIVTILLTCSAIAIASVGELDEWRGSRPTLAHVSCLAVAHFALFFVYVGSTETFLCSFSGVKINKCCDQNESFDGFFKCFPVNASSYFHEDNYNFKAVPCADKSVQIEYFPDFNISKSNGDLITLNETFPNLSYCVEEMVEDGYENILMVHICPCYKKLCIRKCCKKDEDLHFGYDKHFEVNCSRHDAIEKEKWTLDYFLNGEKIRNDIHLMQGFPRCGDKQLVQWSDGYKILEDGSLESTKDDIIPPGFYCSDFAWHGNERRHTIVACAEMQEQERFIISAVGFLIGSFFLLLTTIIYIWLPEFKGLPAMTLIAHNLSLMSGCVLSAIRNLFVEIGTTFMCRFFAFTAQFSFLAAFFWLNVMCVDIAWTFSGIRPPGGSQKDRDRRKFMWYSIFAWTGASVITMAALIVDLAPGIPEDSVFKPNTGANKCWFQSKESTLVFFYGPMGILIFANIVMFVYTLYKIYLLKKGTSSLRQGDSARHGGSKENTKNTQRFVLYVKLFSLMGITWIMEIVSWAVGGSPKLWYLTDLINALRGVFIFYIFCCKPKVWTALKRKLSWLRHLTCCRTSTPDAEQTTTSTNTDKTTKDNVIEMRPA